MSKNITIPYYSDYVSPAFIEHAMTQAAPVAAMALEVPDLMEVGEGGGLESPESLTFLCKLYDQLEAPLKKVLHQRQKDRAFIDQRTKAYHQYNKDFGIDFADVAYQTVLGDKDAAGRIVLGPLTEKYNVANGNQIAPLPDFLKGPHVTLFGPPDSEKLSINAMNAFHRVLKDEPAIIAELLASQNENQPIPPRWGADDEDSKTPLRDDLVSAGRNLTGCLNKSIRLEDEKRGKVYELNHEGGKLAQPFKRFPGLALPCTFLYYKGSPMPLHLYDFALHFFENWHNPEALVFYVPKIENEEEAAYIHTMMATAEAMIQELHPAYKSGTIRLLIVLENPRAVFRVNEMMDALYPFFAGASLGWHDYLGSTARLFKEDANYRIPVKADPEIVIKHIKASHQMLADVVGPRGGIKIGGMYGILPTDSDLFSDSFQVTIVGYIRDIITQFKRGLNGFWVAHPDFVRIGMALVEAWRLHEKGDEQPLIKLVEGLVVESRRPALFDFINGDDIPGLDKSDPMYPRALIVADRKESVYIANNHPDEIRYNVFQSLQYLADWLRGNGCVALPAQVDGVPVRVMDDLATAERSRWEVWHEIYHNRISLKDFLQIAHEELNFIRKDFSDDKKIVQVKWDAGTAKWYPVAFQLMVKLMTDEQPAEFATEYLMPFTDPSIRRADDPWTAMLFIDLEKYRLPAYAYRLNHFFEICGDANFADQMAQTTIMDLDSVEKAIRSFDKTAVIAAASFHGNIGEGKKTLDKMATAEQAAVHQEENSPIELLKEWGSKYLKKFGVKFLISANGKTGSELLAILKERYLNSEAQELDNAREALWQITQKRLTEHPIDSLAGQIQASKERFNIVGASISVSRIGKVAQLQNFVIGDAVKNKEAVTENTWFEIASLSKTIGSAFAIEYFAQKGISLETSVNQLLKEAGSTFSIHSIVSENNENAKNADFGDKIQLKHLMNHNALNMHYVNGVPLSHEMPSVRDFLDGNAEYDYESVIAINKPGTKFSYSGGGFMVLQHLIEQMESKSIDEDAISETSKNCTLSAAEGHNSETTSSFLIDELTRPFLDKLGMTGFSFNPKNIAGQNYANGYKESGFEVEDFRLMFPAFAAGGLGTPKAMMQFLIQLSDAYNHAADKGNKNAISHNTAVKMLFGTDNGCQEFMGANMGLGVFVAEAGPNKIALHQGANDGFRSLYIYCFSGPDTGKGFTIYANGDNNAMMFISEVAQSLFRELNLEGIDLTKFPTVEFDTDQISQEEIVNLGYKHLIFDAFEADLPEEIIEKGDLDPFADKNIAVGADLVETSNQKFARAENLVSDRIPVFNPELFGRQGKIMDSWETVRHNPKPSDYLVFQLENPSVVKQAIISTKYHLGNQAEFVMVEGYCKVDDDWVMLVNKTALEGHAQIQEDVPEINHDKVISLVRVTIFPDGGLTRLSLFAEPVSPIKEGRFEEAIPQPLKPLAIECDFTEADIQANYESVQVGEEYDVANLAFGGKVVHASDEHYAPAKQVLSPYLPVSMFDGFESARSREADHNEEIVIQLGKITQIHRIEIDFTYFVNNNPVEISLLGLTDGIWVPFVVRTSVKAFAGLQWNFNVEDSSKFEQVKVLVYPDGGMNRVRVLTKK